ncbi:hypothetical protein [Pseudoalteromonas sp. MMG006]|uniref:hypothetical protein n=1 Tax=Pseudoalteromonas sp. MMG006 TaxID=2822683 RepID=UPI001FFC4F5D|nr:hypothetical protein [Pseudoalteromonas sp. MMG006]
MIKQNNNSHVKLFNRTLIKLLVLPLFLFVSTFALADDTSLNSTLNKLDFKTTQSLVNNIRANKLDYLINQQKLTQAFEISKERIGQHFT